MKSITVAIEDDIYALAEQKAFAQQTSVDEVVVRYLEKWIAEDDRIEQARCEMATRFAQPDWRFAVGTADDRTQRNARS